jgi:hypothetical protein
MCVVPKYKLTFKLLDTFNHDIELNGLISLSYDESFGKTRI